MSDVYDKKDLSSMDENYSIFMTAKMLILTIGQKIIILTI